MGSAIVVIATAVIAGAQQYRAAQIDKDVARRNAQLARIAAQDAITRGALEEARSRRGFAQLLGEQRAIAGASGLEVDVGSPLFVQESTALLGELEALTIRNNAAREAWGFENQATMFGFQSALASSAGARGAFLTVGTGVAQGVGLNRQLTRGTRLPTASR